MLWPLIAIAAMLLAACSSPRCRETRASSGGRRNPEARRLLQGRRPRRQPTAQYRGDSRCNAAARVRCIASPIARTRFSGATMCRRRHCARTRSAASLRGTDAGFTAAKTATGETYDMYAHDRGAPDIAAALVRARHQRRQRQKRHRARQRPRAVSIRAASSTYHSRPRIALASRKGQWRSRRRSILPSDCAAGDCRARRCRHGRRGRCRARRGGSYRTGGGRVRGATGRVRQSMPTLKTSSPISRTKQPARASKPRCGRIDGLFRVFVGPYPTRDDARRALDVLRDTAGPRGNREDPMICSTISR